MRETPLHVASAKNDVDILKYLLDWTGPETAELEARNTVSHLNHPNISRYVHSIFHFIFVNDQIH
jgi:hypothetical protein